MYTQCSSCATLFRVTSQHLRQAQGLVRCCLCHEVFDALSSLVETLPSVLAAHWPTEPALAGVAGGASRATAAPVSAVRVLEEDLFVSLPKADGSLSAVLTGPIMPPPRRGVGPLTLAGFVVLLLVVLVLPYAYLTREDLSRYPQLRPWLDGLCAAVGCQLPPLREVSRIHILYKDVGMSFGSPPGLLATLTLVNDAGFHQPYPQIRLGFLDPTDAMQTSRWFSPDEYLSEQQQLGLVVGMPPQEPISVQLMVTDVSAAAVDNFVLDLR